jgi:hypothetical protein
MNPKMIPVLSSNIDGVAHLSDLTLLVTFKSAKTYAYDNVPKDVFDGMQAASSKGNYLNEVIKKGGYAFHLLTNVEVDALLSGAPAAPPVTPAPPRVKLSIKITELVGKYPFLRLAF